MAQYVIAREGASPSAGDMLLSLTTGLEEIAQINEIAVMGEATSSGVNRMAYRRSTSNLGTPTAQTPAKLSPTSPAAYTAAATTASAQPTTAAAPAVWTYALNCFGGVVRWSAGPKQEIFHMGATAGSNEGSLESSNGTNSISCQIIFEEV